VLTYQLSICPFFNLPLWTVYGIKKNAATRKRKWLEELRQEREKDIKVETMGK